MKTVLFVSKGEQASSTRYRAFNYFPMLQENSWEARHITLRNGAAGKSKLLAEAARADVVVLIRRGLAFPALQQLRRASKKLVFDFDDAIFLRSSGKPSRGRLRRFKNTLRKCDQVWAGNGYLAENARRYNDKVIILPTSVATERYVGTTEKPDASVDLVWIGSSSTRRYIESLLPVLEAAVAQLPQLRLKIIADFSLESESLPIIAVPWSEDSEVSSLKSAHIGLAPMRDDPWSRGKCALKVLQYMASGLPVISSDVGANAEVIEQGQTGFLVNTEAEWISAIGRLYRSPELRTELGNTGMDRCERQYSQRICSEIMLNQLEKLMH